MIRLWANRGLSTIAQSFAVQAVSRPRNLCAICLCAATSTNFIRRGNSLRDHGRFSTNPIRPRQKIFKELGSRSAYHAPSDDVNQPGGPATPRRFVRRNRQTFAAGRGKMQRTARSGKARLLLQTLRSGPNELGPVAGHLPVMESRPRKSDFKEEAMIDVDLGCAKTCLPLPGRDRTNSMGPRFWSSKLVEKMFAGRAPSSLPPVCLSFQMFPMNRSRN